ncbi:MAG TPA: hypothetical protein PKA58_04135 [Polyangium sp.]|nr:hypothetical protein [Polyangium sp.]
MSKIQLFAILAIAAAQPILTGCGPSQAQIDPRNVADLQIRPASGQALFCPGAHFGVEFVAKLKDGTTCSNLNEESGCMNQKNTVIDPAVLRLTGSNGKVDGQGWVTDADPLKTADSGVRLEGWLEQVINGQNQLSKKASLDMKPVYECMSAANYSQSNGRNDGTNGAAGAAITIAITSLSTPFYPDAALVRVESGTMREYFISPSADKPIRITAAGQPGAQGRPGTNGTNGNSGTAGAECKNGTDGTDGTAGIAGGRGGDGGAGATIKVILDEGNPDKLKGRLLISNPGGAAGEGGMGGQGGVGGTGGPAGTKPANAASDCNPQSGKSGQNGVNGPNGPRGNAGPNGPAPTFENGKRATVWANEMQAIQRIEGSGGKTK